MIAFAAAAYASDVDLAVERARVALDEGRPTDAMALVAPFVDDRASDVWPAHQVFLEASDAAMLGYESRAVYETLGLLDARAAAVWTWHEVGLGLAEPGALAEYAADAPDLVPLGLAWLSYGQGAPSMAVAFGAPLETADGADVVIRAFIADRDLASAEKWAKSAAASWPHRPDVLAGLWTKGAGGLSRVRDDLLTRAVGDALATSDVTRLYRARRLAIAAHDDDSAKALSDRLVALGESRPAIDRPPWVGSTREAAAGVLAGTPTAQWPRMTAPERSRIARTVALMLEDRGRVDDALALLATIPDDPEVFAVAARVAMSADRFDEALAAVASGLRVACLADGADTHALASDLAQLHATRAGIYVAQGRMNDGALELALATALQPAAEWEDARSRLLSSAPPASDPLHTAARVGSLAGVDAREALASALLDASPSDAERLIAVTDAALIGTGPSAVRAWGERAPLVAGVPRAAFVAYARADDDVHAAEVWPYDELPLSAASGRAAVLARASAAKPTSVSGGRPKLGGMVPDFTIASEMGETTATSLKGRVVVVTFWASWCGPCMQELPATATLVAKLREEGHAVTVLAIGTDEDQPSYQKTMRRPDLAPLTFAWSPELALRFGVEGIPDTWIVDGDGVLRFHQIGYGEGAEAKMEREIRSLLR